ncbi:ectoine/hydroxyectoine ABC transporter permease subunit EhuD [Phytohabitans flavus]|uniref:Ectoine/hydroxyectoine ABC transporter permease subunit EhuD n=1 Tax=Phytohabitans flavus TaxID=1076124 RepID=A0A6F8XN97_9ACTN|nr:amino acid ABC transporter permease [Phytohabitans flavus]BCB75277.1 ectoine/hydroxyectoine ABC transporter permease subunit EhuD [Phytohabitans flavus]
MSWDWRYAWQIVPTLLDGVAQTFLVTLVSATIALLGGLAVAVTRWLSPAVVRAPLWLLVELTRGVPILVLLFFCFYGLPGLGLRPSAFVTGVVVLGAVYAAYCSEVYRGGLASVPPTVWDASAALGLSTFVTWTRVILPTVVRANVGALGNYVVILYKQTALLFTIGVPVLLTNAQVAGYESFRYLEPFTLAGVLYLLLNLPSVWLVRRLEKRMTRGGF